MKTIYTILLCCFLITMDLTAQVAVNTDGSDPHPSAMLEINATNRGFLIPRISDSERNAIPSPATGLLLYNSTTNLLNYFNGTFWYEIQSVLVSNTTGILRPGGGVSISATGDGSPDSSAMLDVFASGRGILMPRTTPGSIAAPATGLIIYNSATNLFNYYNGVNWAEIIAASTGVSPAVGSQTPIGCGIKADGTDPHPSAMLDVSAPDRGLLMPRLTNSQRDAILPGTGLAIYNTSSSAIEFFNGSGWYRLNVSFTCGAIMQDSRDGQSYNTVQIGTQCWMAENLNYGLMTSHNSQMSNNGIAEKYCYENDEINCQEWGAFYQWDEAMQYTTVESTQGICPDSWHIPSEAEWDVLEDFLGGYYTAGGQLKQAGYSHWISPNTGATNSSGFTALGSGRIAYTETNPSSGLYTHCYIWSSTLVDAQYARRRGLFYFSARSYPYFDYKWLGFSVRCVKD